MSQRDVRRKLLPERHVWHEYELGGGQVATYRPDGAEKTVERKRLGDVFLCAKRQRLLRSIASDEEVKTTTERLRNPSVR